MNPLTSKIALVQPEKLCHLLWILTGKSKNTVITIMIKQDRKLGLGITWHQILFKTSYVYPI
jgi:hypothetical protein